MQVSPGTVLKRPGLHCWQLVRLAKDWPSASMPKLGSEKYPAVQAKQLPAEATVPAAQEVQTYPSPAAFTVVTCQLSQVEQGVRVLLSWSNLPGMQVMHSSETALCGA